jgi:transposase
MIYRFVRWRRAGVWGRMTDALATAHDAAVQMIDTSIVRVRQHGACITRNQRQSQVIQAFHANPDHRHHRGRQHHRRAHRDALLFHVAGHPHLLVARWLHGS